VVRAAQRLEINMTGASIPGRQAPTTKILLDAPSAGPALGFHRTAVALAQVIEDSSPRFAIGIFGGWGSGKTTLMQAIQRELSDTVVKVNFNAWRFEREPQLLVPLLDTIRAALIDWSKDRGPETRERVRGIARRVGRVIRSLAAGLSGEVGLPGAAKISYDVSKAVDALTTKDDPDLPQSLYVAAFRELSEAFSEFTSSGASRVVIFVDDLDRCLPSNALDVLESMKLFFDLPGFIFVVGLDEDVVQRAVRTRFPDITSGVQPSTGQQVPPSATPLAEGQLEREYLEKIFQVPYRLPPMVAEQLHDLVEAMYQEADLPTAQLNDFRGRVAPHLRYVAVERQVNPREVKRFLNTYTLQSLVRPELDRDTVLPLQTLLFRYEWRTLYDAILTDSILFVDALGRYRSGDDFAFEDLSPELSVLPAELGEYLRSDAAEPLSGNESLDAYMSSLETTGTTPRWLTDAYRDIGRLRGEIRRVRAVAAPTEADRHQLAGVAKECVSKLGGMSSYVGPVRSQVVAQLLNGIEIAAQELEKRSPDIATASQEPEATSAITNNMYELANRVYRELRTARDTLTPSARS
jgi:hypothetical protein